MRHWGMETLFILVVANKMYNFLLYKENPAIFYSFERWNWEFSGVCGEVIEKQPEERCKKCKKFGSSTVLALLKKLYVVSRSRNHLKSDTNSIIVINWKQNVSEISLALDHWSNQWSVWSLSIILVLNQNQSESKN